MIWYKIIEIMAGLQTNLNGFGSNFVLFSIVLFVTKYTIYETPVINGVAAVIHAMGHN